MLQNTLLKGSFAHIRITVFLTAANLLILGLRNAIVGESFFNFLKSNLFIGSLPVIVLAFIIHFFHKKMNIFLFWILTALWVLFYPNAPYMISDLIHNYQDPLSVKNAELIKFDTLIIFSIAMLSVFYGFLSLKLMFSVFKTKYGNRFAHTAIFITIVLSCIGFYVGRELISALKIGNGYIYSWEIFLEPVFIIKTVWHALFPIGEHKSAYYMMTLFGAVQYLLLIMFRDVQDIEADNNTPTQN